MPLPATDSAKAAPAGIARKVYVIGLDGAPLDIIRQGVLQGYLPTMARLMAEGAYGPLASVIPPISAPAWTSFATGTNPGQHGIVGFRQRVLGSYDVRLVNGQDRQGAPLWRLLNRHGLQVAVVNLPMTYPPEPVDGILVSGMDTPSERVTYTHPPELADELAAQLGRYMIELPLLAEARRADYEKIQAKIDSNLDNRIAAVKYLLAAYDSDFFVVNFRETDSALHYFWAQEGPAPFVLHVCRKLDEFLAWLVERLPEDTLLFVISDHGFGPAGERAVFLNRWLLQEGYLAVRSSPASHLPLQRLTTWARLHMPDTMRRWLWRLWPKGVERARETQTRQLVDWSRTRVYADEQQGMLWANVAGRDPQGIVEPGQACEELLREVAAKLSALRDPATGDLVASKVYHRDEVFVGRAASLAPDLVVLPATDPPYQFLPSDLSATGEIVMTVNEVDNGLPVLRGTHRQNGMLLAWGEGVQRSDSDLPGLALVDMAPTILHALGCPLPPNMDGRVLTELFKQPGIPVYRDDPIHEPGHDAAYGSVEDQQELEDRLRGLGYID